MKTLTYTEARRVMNGGQGFIQPLRPSILLRNIRLLIENSDWDERIIHHEPLLNKICWVVVILSGLAVAPFLLSLLSR